MRGAAHQPGMMQSVLVDRAHGDALVVRERLAQPVDAVQHVQQVEALVREVHAFRFDLAHVKHVVDQREQLIGGAVDLVQAQPHACRIVHMVARDADHADDAVDGRAHIVTHARKEFRLRGVGGLGVEDLLLQQALLVVHENEQHRQRHAHVGAGQRGEEELQDGARHQRDHVDDVVDHHAAPRHGAILEIPRDGHRDGPERVAVGQHEHEHGEQRAAHVGAIRFYAEHPPRPQRGDEHHDQKQHGNVDKGSPALFRYRRRVETQGAEAEEEVCNVAAGQVEREVEQVVSPEAGSRADTDAQRVGQRTHGHGGDKLDDPLLLASETRRAGKLVHQKHIDEQQKQDIERIVRIQNAFHGCPSLFAAVRRVRAPTRNGHEKRLAHYTIHRHGNPVQRG